VEAVIGGSGNDMIYGNFGGDLLSGGSGADVIYGGQDNDTMAGGSGNDYLYGNLDNDLMTGGTGADVFVFGNNQGNDTIADFDLTADFVGIISGVNGITSGSDAVARTSDVGGTAVVDLGSGNTVTLTGLTTADLRTFDFWIL
jgi:Ca2+-binding RTX toxin-like protein